jgi:hypothetical protein
MQKKLNSKQKKVQKLETAFKELHHQINGLNSDRVELELFVKFLIPTTIHCDMIKPVGSYKFEPIKICYLLYSEMSADSDSPIGLMREEREVFLAKIQGYAEIESQWKQMKATFDSIGGEKGLKDLLYC